MVRGERRGRRWRRITHGLHSDGACTFERQLHGWSLVLPPSAVWTHLTAAELRGWWLPNPVPHPVFAAVGLDERHPQRRGLSIFRLREHPGAEMVLGLRVATAAGTLLAAARDLAVLDLVALADSAVRSRDCSMEDLVEVASSGRPGAGVLRAVLPLLDPLSESPWESVMRVLHRAAGIPLEPQHTVLDAGGRFVADWRHYGYTAAEVLRCGPLIASVDTALGRRWAVRGLAPARRVLLVGCRRPGPGGCALAGRRVLSSRTFTHCTGVGFSTRLRTRRPVGRAWRPPRARSSGARPRSASALPARGCPGWGRGRGPRRSRCG